MNDVLGVRTIKHPHGLADGCGRSILIASGDGQFGALHQRTGGRSVDAVLNSISLGSADALASGLAICHR